MKRGNFKRAYYRRDLNSRQIYFFSKGARGSGISVDSAILHEIEVNITLSIHSLIHDLIDEFMVRTISLCSTARRVFTFFAVDSIKSLGASAAVSVITSYIAAAPVLTRTANTPIH